MFLQYLLVLVLQAIQSLDAGDYKINVSVSDGKFRTFADVRLHVWSITDNMAENAVVIRFKGMPAEEFMSAHKRKLLKVRTLTLNEGTYKYLRIR